LPSHYAINGRFGAQRVTGVQRVAHALLRALDAQERLPGQWQLLAPPGIEWPPLARIALASRGFPPGGGHAWEQWAVAEAAARGARVLNIAGSGPWLGGPQVSWLHDAAVFDHPQAYRPAFVAWYRALFRRRASRGDLLLVPSRFAQQRLALALGVPESRLLVLPHGADHLDAVEPDASALQLLGLADADFWLCIASANPTKNLQRLLAAHARLPAAGRPRLVLAGGANPRVFAPSSAAPAGSGVMHVAAPGDALLKALLRQARALVLPSLVEGFGLPAVEARRAACAVVAARAGALPEVCGPRAEYVDPLDVDDICRGLQATLAPGHLAWLRGEGPEGAAARCWGDVAHDLLRLLADWEASR